MSTPDLSSLKIDRDAPARSGGDGPLRALLIGAAVLLVAAAVVWFLLPKGTSVRVALVETTGGGAAVAGGISANGYVVARTKASVSAKLPGRLDYLGVTEGTRVRKGDTIARIESADFEAALAAARATEGQYETELMQARRELERARRLRDEAVISIVDLEDAETGARVAEARLATARAQVALAVANLENTRIRAPFDGTVLRKDAEVGEMVAPSSAGGGLTRTAIATIADLATLEVEVDVNEAYIAQIDNGQPARITLDAYPDTSFSGRVRQVVPTADRQKATVQVKVSILDRDPRILPEMGAKVVFVREGGVVPASAPRRVRIPSAAVAGGAENPAVWVVRDERVSKVSVELGPAEGERVEVRRGLQGGERVVLEPPAGLTEGMKVRVES
jgi:RND family efflux transporter MFP subunit